MSNKIDKKENNFQRLTFSGEGGEEWAFCNILLFPAHKFSLPTVPPQFTLSEPSADSGLAAHPDEWDDEPVMTAAAGVNGHLTALGCKVGGLVMK